MKIKNIVALAALTLPMGTMAQSIHFETEDYKSLGIYDTWTESPFRTKELSGHYGVIANHLTDVDDELGIAPNTSGKILAVQRSRFGSNTFGVRINLKEPFELTTTNKYIHVRVNRPYSGRVMVVGLGKRRDRPGQSPETEQFWAMSTTGIPANRWYEVVLPIKGNGGIDIHSLVIVPDCESPHKETEDKICYIDDIEVNNIPTPDFTYGSYLINFDKTQERTRTDRILNDIQLSTTSSNHQTAKAADSNLMYNNIGNVTFQAKPGETLTPRFGYNGEWMHGYVYIDLNQNGRFEAPLDESGNLIKKDCELLAYSFYGGNSAESGYNSAGQFLTGNARSVVNPPAFTLPADVTPGYYHMRYKVDWNNADPGGCVDPSNSIINNGGAIMDIRINIHTDQCQVNSANRNGTVLKSDGTNLDGVKVPFGQPLTIKVEPSNGFDYSGVVIKHGYHLNADSIKHEVIQWERVTVNRNKFNSKNEYTIPAEYMDGFVEIEGIFVSGEFVDPGQPTRYQTTMVTENGFAEGTPWYTMQIGNEGYVIAYSQYRNYFPLYDTEINTENPAQLWCFTGNDEEGYKLYNKQAGPNMVLAASTDVSDNTGGNNHPCMYQVNAIPEGYISTWRFIDSPDLGTVGPEYAYMYEDGYETHKVNNRNSILSFWSTGQDAGSTLRIHFATKDLPTDISQVTTGKNNPSVYYDTNGRRISHPVQHGVYISDQGHKTIR